MVLFWKTTGVILTAATLGILLRKEQKDMETLLSLAVCCIVFGIAASFIDPVINFLQQIKQIGQLDNEFLRILVKASGIGMTAELAAFVCEDSGNATLGKLMHTLGTSAMLYMSLPIFTSMINCIQEILNKL